MDHFLAALLAHLRKRLPAAAIEVAGDGLTVNGTAVPVDVYAAAYASASWLGRGSVVRQAAEAIAHDATGFDAFDSYDVARDRLRARVTTDAAMDVLRLRYLVSSEASTPRPVWRPLAGDLVVEPVLDRPDAVVRIHREMLRAWAVGEDELLADALAATCARGVELGSLHGVEGCASADALVALEPLLDDTRPGAVVMAPHAGVVFVLDREDSNAWERAAAFALARARVGDALSAAAIAREDGRWVEVTPPAHVCDLLEEAVIAIQVRRYHDQADALAAAFPELAVAPVDREGPRTSATVTRGRAAVLPVVDRVAFVDGGHVREVDWHELATTPGVTLEPFASVPPRVQLTGWPA